MPYRAELKRPDLKGSFPCSVCGKIFCHSSSLSRHRMQAHFKSYTCTQCNQEISSNDTLRSHMFRLHNISRMFMCRCCNWAFPDKTSLHIHMQSMLRNGSPGDVAVLARSSSEGDDSPIRSPISLKKQIIHHQQHLHNNNHMSSIFPNLVKPGGESTSSPSKAPFPLDLSVGPNQFLTAWLANNPLNTANLGFLKKPEEEKIKVEDMSEYDELEVRTTEEDMSNDLIVSPRSVIVKNENEKKRKFSYDDNVDVDVEGDEEIEPPLKMTIIEKEEHHHHHHISHDQPSPTVSDSHISGSSSHSGESAKCFDCQVAKGKLSAAEEKCKNYEKQIRDLQHQIEMFRKITFPPMVLPNPIPVPPPVVGPPMMPNILQNPAMRNLLSIFQNQMNRQMC
ncbi:unnamed protein product [Caenorhabditis angaria]|uniref:C2H2-type domain-containing protein n=1 Tax=Caenorhabditis angaria TaxID=860376 RepID=A0A9P1J533_9PELO|nr:unnamed protein product [Caenorhabditis angaria]